MDGKPYVLFNTLQSFLIIPAPTIDDDVNSVGFEAVSDGSGNVAFQGPKSRDIRLSYEKNRWVQMQD